MTVTVPNINTRLNFDGLWSPNQNLNKILFILIVIV